MKDVPIKADTLHSENDMLKKNISKGHHTRIKYEVALLQGFL